MDVSGSASLQLYNYCCPLCSALYLPRPIHIYFCPRNNPSRSNPAHRYPTLVSRVKKQILRSIVWLQNRPPTNPLHDRVPRQTLDAFVRRQGGAGLSPSNTAKQHIMCSLEIYLAVVLTTFKPRQDIKPAILIFATLHGRGEPTASQRLAPPPICYTYVPRRSPPPAKYRKACASHACWSIESIHNNKGEIKFALPATFGLCLPR